MALYRCAACGSPNVVTDTQKEGYDYVKGAIGTVVLGAGGAVAGLDGKKKTVYKCPDCGVSLSYCMPDHLKRIIDMGVISEEARYLSLNGAPIDWSALKQQYRNIEENTGSQLKHNLQEAAVVNKAKATKKEFDAAVDCIEETKRKFGYYGIKRSVIDYYNEENLFTLEDYLAYNSSVCIFIENCMKYIPPESNLHIQYRGLDPHIDLKGLLCEYLLIKYAERTRKCGLTLIRSNEHRHTHYNSELDKMVQNDLFMIEFIKKYSENEGILIPSYNKNLLAAGCYSGVFFDDCYSPTNTHFDLYTDEEFLSIRVYFPKYIVRNGKLMHNAFRPEYGYTDFYDDFNVVLNHYCAANVLRKQDILKEFTVLTAQLSPLDKRISTLSDRNIKIENTELVRLMDQLDPLEKPRLFGKKKARAEADAIHAKIEEIGAELDRNCEEIQTLTKEYVEISKRGHALMSDYDFFQVWEEQ